MKTKNYRVQVENDKLKSELVSASKKVLEHSQNKGRKTIEIFTQTIESKEECKKDIDLELKMKNKKFHDKSPELKATRVLHHQLEIEFKEVILEKQISEGGYGLIYRGRWRESIVAVKMLKIDMKEEHVRDFICITNY